METIAERALNQYVTIYEKIYARKPADISILSGDWLLVSGAQVRASEIICLSEQMERDYILTQAQKRGIAPRVLRWLR